MARAQEVRDRFPELSGSLEPEAAGVDARPLGDQLFEDPPHRYRPGLGRPVRGLAVMQRGEKPKDGAGPDQAAGIPRSVGVPPCQRAAGSERNHSAQRRVTQCASDSPCDTVTARPGLDAGSGRHPVTTPARGQDLNPASHRRRSGPPTRQDDVRDAAVGPPLKSRSPAPPTRVATAFAPCMRSLRCTSRASFADSASPTTSGFRPSRHAPGQDVPQ